MDFSGCGLVIHQLAVKARCYHDNPESVTFTVQGDDTRSVSPQMGGRCCVSSVGLLRVCLQTKGFPGDLCVHWASVECIGG